MAEALQVLVRETASADWDAFVQERPCASLYHLSGWTDLSSEVFGHRTLFVEAREPSGALAGILPVVQQRSWLLGNFATSVACFNYGGALTEYPRVAEELMRRASETVEALGCRYLEFRDVQERPATAQCCAPGQPLPGFPRAAPQQWSQARRL